MADSLKDSTDADLLDRYCDGDEQAFRELVDRYKNGLYAFLRQFLNQHDLVEDVFQETFLQLYSSQGSFDRSRPLRPWLFTIAANKAKDALRKSQRTSAISISAINPSDEMSFEEMLNVLTSDKEQPENQLEQEERSGRVSRIITDLPDNLREIIIMAYFNKFSYKQMADILSIPIGTVKSRLHTAVARFAKEWTTVLENEEM
ncbi:MAG: sigma-70 family RNA polymerase sigma factor [Phycisphaerae bacterium]|nr:sigma-70 family RNA polymerase sigma factor [Phycisphaerae bacterium]